MSGFRIPSPIFRLRCLLHGFAFGPSVVILLVFFLVQENRSSGQQKSTPPANTKPLAQNDAEEIAFQEVVKPLLGKYCIRCHNATNMKSGIRLDQLSARPDDRQLFLWKEIRKVIEDEAMPPKKEVQFAEGERQRLTGWIDRTMKTAMARNTQRNGSIRRLTVAQYRNTLRDLLKLEEDLTEVLPPDAMSKDGFVNHAQTMILSPLLVESYFDIADKALDLCMVDETSRPVIQNFRMDLGRKINPKPVPDKLVLGALSELLDKADFTVTQLKPQKPFSFDPFWMQTKFRFIEGYVGNDTIREWRNFDSIYHAVFACVRGTMGYPKGEAVETVPEGLLLRPAIPNSEIFGVSNTYGPMANFKISLRELPDKGNFRVTVKAARYDDGLLLDPGAPPFSANGKEAIVIEGLDKSPAKTIRIKEPGVYQVDTVRAPGEGKGGFKLQLGERHFSGTLPESKASISGQSAKEAVNAFLLVRLKAGELSVTAQYGNQAALRGLRFHRIDGSSDLGRRFVTFEKRIPSVGVHLGLRRDCGSTLSRVGEPKPVTGGALQEIVFSGAINDYPSPEVEKDNVNYLAGVREIGVRSEYTDGRDMPRLLIRSIEFEGPFYDQWPPLTHRNIFIDSPNKNDPEVYAREIIQSFATRAYRRPVSPDELETLLKVWKESFSKKKDFRASIKNTLIVVLTSPQFLFLIENSAGPESEDLTDHELASKLSYFLWNAPPDQRLLELAANHQLRGSLDGEVERLIADPRFHHAMNEFASQWLSLDKFDVVSVDEKRFPRLTRLARIHLRQEPVQFLQYLIRNNLPLRNLVQSDFVVANETVAHYYGLGDRTESGFDFVPIKHDKKHLGGLLSQAGILSGLSDGRESNPVKRGAWFARKIVAEPPDDPPPNVPKLPEDDGKKLTLREKLERHRNQEGCAKCHAGIDPWGLPFEEFDASGLFKVGVKVEAKSKLPDGAQVEDLNGLKNHLLDDRMEQIAFSYLKHMACYATGRSLSYNETVFLKEQAANQRKGNYPAKDLIKFLIKSDLFLKK